MAFGRSYAYKYWYSDNPLLSRDFLFWNGVRGWDQMGNKMLFCGVLRVIRDYARIWGKRGIFWGWIVEWWDDRGGCEKVDKLGNVEDLSWIVKNLSWFGNNINSLIFKIIMLIKYQH